MLSIYKLIKPPVSGNCRAESRSGLNFNDFKLIFSENSAVLNRQKHIADLKLRLNGLINNDSWDEEDCVGENSSEVIDCVIFFFGFVRRKLLQQISCDKCKSALIFEDVFSNRPEAELTNLKTFGFLTHANINIFRILKAVEEYFAQNINTVNVYEDTIDHIVHNVPLSFPCEAHKEDVIAYV
jgi:hypothetical protein